MSDAAHLRVLATYMHFTPGLGTPTALDISARGAGTNDPVRAHALAAAPAASGAALREAVSVHGGDGRPAALATLRRRDAAFAPLAVPQMYIVTAMRV